MSMSSYGWRFQGTFSDLREKGNGGYWASAIAPDGREYAAEGPSPREAEEALRQMVERLAAATAQKVIEL